MKIILDYGVGGIYTMIVPPSILVLIAAILVVLIIAKWHYSQKKKEMQFKQWEITRNDYRTLEADCDDRKSSTGNRQEELGRKHDKPSLQ